MNDRYQIKVNKYHLAYTIEDTVTGNIVPGLSTGKIEFININEVMQECKLLNSKTQKLTA